MKTKLFAKIIGWLSTVIILAAAVAAQTNEFTYQGKISDAGMQAAAYDFEFRLCDSEANSCSPPLATSVQNAVPVTSGGVFTVKLDFGAANFDGSDRFLEIAMRRANEGSFVTLAPRQKLTSAPYAIKSQKATDAQQLGGTAANQFVLTTDPRLDTSNYVLNTNTTQSGVNFNIGGTGTANVLNAATQFNLNGSRILSNPGTGNLFAGVNAGQLNSTGSFNTFYGFGAGANNITGSRNTMLGYNASQTSENITNSTAVGANARVTQSNSLILGSINGVNGATADTSVGIGTTAPGFKFHIIDPSNTGFRVQTNSAGGTIASFGGKGAFQIDTATVAGGRFSVLENGNVGIGNAAPGFKLQILDQSNAGLRVQTNTTGGTVASFGGNGVFQVDAVNVVGGRLSILENGNVGIGNAAPGAKLSITGTGSASTALEINNGAIKVTGAGFNTNTWVFVAEKNPGNSCGPSFPINNSYTNNDPNAILFVTVSDSRTNTNAVPTVYYETNHGSCPFLNNKWVVKLPYNDSLTVRVNVMVIKP